MNQAELQKLVEEISLQYFHVPFKHEVKINNRMTTTGSITSVFFPNIWFF